MIEHRDSTANIEPRQLTEFFQDWLSLLSSEKHLEMLNKSDIVILAFDTEANRVVGFVTALTDFVQAAFISLLEVIPSYREQGIGTELMKRMLARLENVTAIDLTCNPELQPFYARLNMLPSVGMIIRNDRKR
ncbi:MAG: GNAT family N-acetyltransferase [Deinococcota bacterium]